MKKYEVCYCVALFFSAKSKTLNSRSSNSFGVGSVIRRTASLDTIYLKGQWPRESFYMYCGHLLVDKSTQVSKEHCVVIAPLSPYDYHNLLYRST